MLYNQSANMLEYISSKTQSSKGLGSDDWTLLEGGKKLHTKLNGCHSTTGILWCFPGQYSLPSVIIQTSQSLTPTSHCILTRWLCLQQNNQKGVALSFQHHKPTSTYIPGYKERRVSLPYLRPNLSDVLCIPSPQPLSELHTLSSLQTPTLVIN